MRWDLVVIGGGTAGLVAAKTAAGFGARVLLVERERTGGDCLYTGCVPSKAFLAAAHLAAAARAAASYGLRTTVEVDFAAVMTSVHRAIRTIEPVDSPQALEAAGARVRFGEARFRGPDRLEVDGEPVEFRRAVIATGSAPAVPRIEGLVDPLTSDSVWGLTELPERLLVLGGGAIGCELGQGFARLGARVRLVEAGDRLLEKEDAAASDLVAAALRADGVEVRTGTTMTSVPDDVDRVLVAVGRRPRSDGLADAVELDERGFVRVDQHLRTSNPRIWAAGDVTGHPLFTHLAGVHGSIAATNAVLGLRRSIDLTAVPRVTYTQPEVAAVGAATGAQTHVVQHREVDRAVTEQRTAGFTKLVLDEHGRVVGGTIVGPRAGESLAELTLAVKQGLRARDLAATIHAYPTYGDGPWKAAIEDVQDALNKPVATWGIRALRAARTVS